MQTFAKYPAAISLALTAIILSAAFLNRTPRPAEAFAACDTADEGMDAEEMAFLAQINQYRASYGLAALIPAAPLNRTAAWLANDMAARNYFNHIDSAGRPYYMRLWDCGITLWYTGENIAAGTNASGGGSAFNMWRVSPGHNANMLNPYYRYIGIARHYDATSPYSWYWVTDFSAWW